MRVPSETQQALSSVAPPISRSPGEAGLPVARLPCSSLLLLRSPREIRRRDSLLLRDPAAPS
jgi:hypothetical protein